MLFLPQAPVLTRLTQRVPECDMVLVHDDSLAQIGEICTSTVVSTHLPSTYRLLTYLQPRGSLQRSDIMINLLQNYQPKIDQILCGEPLDASLANSLTLELDAL